MSFPIITPMTMYVIGKRIGRTLTDSEKNWLIQVFESGNEISANNWIANEQAKQRHVKLVSEKCS